MYRGHVSKLLSDDLTLLCGCTCLKFGGCTPMHLDEALGKSN